MVVGGREYDGYMTHAAPVFIPVLAAPRQEVIRVLPVPIKLIPSCIAAIRSPVCNQAVVLGNRVRNHWGHNDRVMANHI